MRQQDGEPKNSAVAHASVRSNHYILKALIAEKEVEDMREDGVKLM